MGQENRINEFGEKIDELFKHFFKYFKVWADDLEDLTERRQKSAAISTRFLDKRGKALLDDFDRLITDLIEEYLKIALEYQDITLAEKKEETDKRLQNFMVVAKDSIQRMNAKAEVLLTDFLKSPFKPETEERLKKIENYTLEDLVNKIHKSLEDSE